MKEKGQSLVELAISFVMLMFLLSGSVEFGIVFFKLIQLKDAAQEGALYGSICQDNAEINRRLRGASDSPLDLQGSDIFVEIEIVENGDAIRVAAIHQHKIFMPFIPEMVGVDYINIKGQVIDTILTRTTVCQ